MGSIYVLSDECSEIFYVGQTVESIDHRLDRHLGECLGSHADYSDPKQNEIRRMLRMGLRPQIEEVQCLPSYCLNAAEATWYNHYLERGAPLKNKMPLKNYVPSKTVMLRQKEIGKSGLPWVPFPPLRQLLKLYPSDYTAQGYREPLWRSDTPQRSS